VRDGSIPLDRTPLEARASIVKAKLKLLNQHRPALIQVDLGEKASKKAKDNLFE
jgi:hypothetical protein